MAKKQEWWLARDGAGEGGCYILSQYPLWDRCADEIYMSPSWIAEGGDPIRTFSAEVFEALTQGQCVLEQGAKPRKVHLRLIVEEC